MHVHHQRSRMRTITRPLLWHSVWSVVLVPCKFGRMNLVSVLVSSTETIFGARGFGCGESVELFDFAFSVILCESVCLVSDISEEWHLCVQGWSVVYTYQQPSTSPLVLRCTWVFVWLSFLYSCHFFGFLFCFVKCRCIIHDVVMLTG